jgi:hypothetical protein
VSDFGIFLLTRRLCAGFWTANFALTLRDFHASDFARISSSDIARLRDLPNPRKSRRWFKFVWDFI